MLPSFWYDFLSQISADNAPEVTPTPATINPTSPLEIIPIPTFMALLLFLKNINDGMPQPISFVNMAIDMNDR